MSWSGVLSAGAQSALLTVLFDQMPFALAIFDRDLRLQSWNATWTLYAVHYAALPADRIAPGMHLAEFAPNAVEVLQPMFERVLAGESVRQDALRLDGVSGVSYWDIVLSPLVSNGRVIGVVNMATDATERVQAYQGLEQRVQERTHELATLLEVAHNMGSTLELKPLLDLILDQLHAVVPFDGASVLTLEGDELGVVAYRGPIAQEQALAARFSLDSSGANRSVIERRAPVIITDVRGEGPLARSFQETAGPRLTTTYGYIRSWLGVPLLHQERVIGMLSLDHGEPYYYTARHGRMALAFAGQVAIALENARLYKAEQERLAEAERRRTVAEGLRDILNVLNSDRPLDEILEYIVAQAGRLMGTDTGAIYRLDGAKNVLEVQASQGLPAEYVAKMQIPVGQGAIGWAVMQGRPTVVDIPDALLTSLFDDPERKRLLRWLMQRFRSLIAVPLLIKNEAYGGLVLYFPERRVLAAEEVELAVSFADQAALAIENARLREQAQRAAVAAERSRLARDLHDAVTQTLFSASLIAEVLPRLWDKQPAEARRRLDELRSLTRGALAEMRTLLVELRPAALIEASLGDLLRQLGEATTGRSRVPVKVTIDGDADLPADVQIALYRIAQEALNNVAKHAGASEALVELCCSNGTVELSIADNGGGFDPDDVGPEHLGLGIMRERAEAAGAWLTIASEPGGGTEIMVKWPA